MLIKAVFLKATFYQPGKHLRLITLSVIQKEFMEAGMKK